ncbi:hypothetical protein V5O48_017421 [Marasmius crinis-equi]|uniref:Uncharacterized protein n=1 Tax=Marasmius crinis-equi TaxID=585013 RepID=A0ABR3EP20_9AGAR
MPAQFRLPKLFLISTALAYIGEIPSMHAKPNPIPCPAAQASTVTFKSVVTPDSAITTASYFVSYSEAGVKSDGSETTYVQDIVISEQLYPSGKIFTLPTPVSAEATLVQSSGGFWISQEATAVEYEIVTSGSSTVLSPVRTMTANGYKSCSLGSDGQCACVQQVPGMTLSYTATASDSVFTNVGEFKQDNHAVGSIVLWQVMVLLCAVMVGGMLVL